MPKYLRVTLIVALTVLLLSGTANALSITWLDVELEMDGSTRAYRTISPTVGTFLLEQGIVLDQFDTVSPGKETALCIDATTKITILPGFDITVDIDGNTQLLTVAEGTMPDDVVKRLEKLTNEAYVIAGSADKALLSGQTLMLNQVFHEEQITTMALPYDTEIIFDDQIVLGEELVDQPGAEGEMIIKSLVTLINGDIIDSQVVSEEIVKNPVTEIVRQGTKAPPTKVQTDKALRSYTRMIEMIATAYTAGYQCTGKHPDHPAYGITASGVRVDHGIVAVDPNVIPLGTKLYVEGYGESLAADTGGAIIGNKIDLYHENLEDAIRFGRRTVKVYVLG